jgi:hypothetical protein
MSIELLLLEPQGGRAEDQGRLQPTGAQLCNPAPAY